MRAKRSFHTIGKSACMCLSCMCLSYMYLSCTCLVCTCLVSSFNHSAQTICIFYIYEMLCFLVTAFSLGPQQTLQEIKNLIDIWVSAHLYRRDYSLTSFWVTYYYGNVSLKAIKKSYLRHHLGNWELQHENCCHEKSWMKTRLKVSYFVNPVWSWKVKLYCKMVCVVHKTINNFYLL